MLFVSSEFLVFFIFVLAFVTVIKNRKLQHLFLLGVSFFFFYYSNNYLISVLIVTIILNYYVAKKLWITDIIQRKKVLLAITLAGNLGILGFFKYVNFSIDQFNEFANYFGISNLEILNVALPIGISFYTFQAISYTVDVYRGKLAPCNSLREFALYVSFFPQLVAGPIVRASVFLPQLREKIENFNFHNNLSFIKIQSQNLKLGATIMALGFLKKIFFADNIARLVNDVFHSPVGHESFSIILATIGFGVQIYADFSGYSDIAIGAALILGFKIPANFNKPFFATSPADYWRRWHISLSSWLRDYLYIPLGGNRKSSARTYANIAVVMFLGGLWHGASWNFVIWGMLNFLYLSAHRWILAKFPRLNKLHFFSTTFGIIVSILITQYLIFLSRIAFRVRDFGDILYSMEKFIILDFATEKTFELILDHKFEVFLIGLFFVLHFISYKKQNIPEIISKFKTPLFILVLYSITVGILLFYSGDPQAFIYFKF